MITERSFTKDWLYAVNKNLGWNRREASLKNLEKAIAALHLLECLAAAGLDFIFKGGTSLILLLRKISRLSVDIDIVVDRPINDIDSVFAGICSRSILFKRFEQQVRDIDAVVGVDHYKFFYQPFADAGEESYILLDFYISINPYANTLKFELASDILDTHGKNVSVRVPDVESILGDKLTAFAPRTIGIPLSAEPGYRPKRVEVLKQLFDIGNLFNLAEDVANIRRTHNVIASHWIDRYGLEITVADVLADSARYAYIIGYGGKIDKPLYDTIAKGYKDFNKFMSDMTFDENTAVLAAAKVAYLVSTLLSGGNSLEKYDREIDMAPWFIADKDYRIFNEYIYNNPEAFLLVQSVIERKKITFMISLYGSNYRIIFVIRIDNLTMICSRFVGEIPYKVCV